MNPTKDNANLDTGIVTLHFSKKEPDQIKNLFDRIDSKELDAFIISPVLIESFYQLAKFPGGIEFAEKCLIQLYKNENLMFVQLEQPLVFKAGIIKSQHQNILSLVDATVIAYSLNTSMKLHTTEKNFKNLFPKLRLQIYSF